MANIFKLHTAKGVGETVTRIGNYIVANTSTSTVIGMTFSNVSSNTISVDLYLNSGLANSSNIYIMKDIVLPVGSTIVESNKVVMPGGFSAYAKSTANNSLDVVMSVLEVTA